MKYGASSFVAFVILAMTCGCRSEQGLTYEAEESAGGVFMPPQEDEPYYEAQSCAAIVDEAAWPGMDSETGMVGVQALPMYVYDGPSEISISQGDLVDLPIIASSYLQCGDLTLTYSFWTVAVIGNPEADVADEDIDLGSSLQVDDNVSDHETNAQLQSPSTTFFSSFGHEIEIAADDEKELIFTWYGSNAVSAGSTITLLANIISWRDETTGAEIELDTTPMQKGIKIIAHVEER